MIEFFQGLDWSDLVSMPVKLANIKTSFNGGWGGSWSSCIRKGFINRSVSVRLKAKVELFKVRMDLRNAVAPHQAVNYSERSTICHVYLLPLESLTICVT